MKKILLPLCAALASFTASAEFTSLKITPLEGDATVVSVEGLEISVADGNLVVTNADGTTTLPVADLASMEFSNDDPSAAVDFVTAETNAAVKIYSIDGRLCGTFTSADDARTVLPAGIYVAKSANGSTSKIAVR